MGALVLATGILYMVTIGRRLLPVRRTADEPLTISEMREYFSDVQVRQESPLIGKNLYESKLGSDYDLVVVSIIRDGKPTTALHRDFVIEEKDHLILKGSAQNLINARETLNLNIKYDHDLEISDLDTKNSHIFEATLSPRSSMVGRTLNEASFRDRFGFTALAIWQQGEIITDHLRDVELQFGDALLLQGPPGRVRALQDGNEFLVLEPVEIRQDRRSKAPISAGIMLLVILLAMATELGIATAMVLGSVLMVLTGCLTMDEAYESIDWRTVFLVGGMLSLGIAMENTGTARFLADLLLGALGDYGPLGLLAGIYLLSALITQPMSNAAAVVLIVPIAVDTALSLGVNHLTFTMAVVIGAATSFLSPVGHKANVLVFGPGGYRFFDYTRIGILLTVALFIVSMIFLPIIWPFNP
jgi:di/tricarboxylate transporter